MFDPNLIQLSWHWMPREAFFRLQAAFLCSRQFDCGLISRQGDCEVGDHVYKDKNLSRLFLGIWSLHGPAPLGDYGKLSMRKTWTLWPDFQSLCPTLSSFLHFPPRGEQLSLAYSLLLRAWPSGRFQGAREPDPLQGACGQWSSGSSRLSWGRATIETTLELAVGVDSPRKHKDWKKDQQFCFYTWFWVVHFVQFTRALYNMTKDGILSYYIVLFCNLVMNSCNCVSWGGLDALTQNNKNFCQRNVLSKRFRL